MANKDQLLQIGEFAKRTGTNLRTLRYYEELGLIRPTKRSAGGFRYYAPDQSERILAIKRRLQLGRQLLRVRGDPLVRLLLTQRRLPLPAQAAAGRRVQL
jgi:hypothetical protein